MRKRNEEDGEKMSQGRLAALLGRLLLCLAARWQSWHFWMIQRMPLPSALPALWLLAGESAGRWSSSGSDSSFCCSIILLTMSLSAPRSLWILERSCSGLSSCWLPKRSFSLTVSLSSSCGLTTKRSNFSLNSWSEIHFLGGEQAVRVGRPSWSAEQNLEEVWEYLRSGAGRKALSWRKVEASMRVMSSLVVWLLISFLARYSSRSLMTSALRLTGFFPPERAIFSISRILGRRVSLAEGSRCRAGERSSLLRSESREVERCPRNLRLNCLSNGPQRLPSVATLPDYSSLITLFIQSPKHSRYPHLAQSREEHHQIDFVIKISLFQPILNHPKNHQHLKTGFYCVEVCAFRWSGVKGYRALSGVFGGTIACLMLVGCG